ncbi:MAG: hypothetical protein FWD34_03295 [Oscillospiraceae bacterium]|nr:hypothetical protein [Oscillospiraceae bacterium]
MAINSVNSIQENHKKYAHLFEDKGKDMATIETFYKLLVAEMSNQDPLDPMSNTEFISQMASFTALQVQQEALYFNNANYAQSMVGKAVIVASSTGTGMDVKTGYVTKVDFSGGQFSVTVDGKSYPLKNVMEVLDGGFGKANGSDGAFATSLIGKYVTVGLVNNVGVGVVEEGVVQRVEIKDGSISIIIKDIAYPLFSVAKVEDAPKEEAKEETKEVPKETP